MFELPAVTFVWLERDHAPGGSDGPGSLDRVPAGMRADVDENISGFWRNPRDRLVSRHMEHVFNRGFVFHVKPCSQGAAPKDLVPQRKRRLGPVPGAVQPAFLRGRFDAANEGVGNLVAQHSGRRKRRSPVCVCDVA